MENIDLKLTISQEKYDKLVEVITRANALTQVILTMPTTNIELIPSNALYNFLMILDDLTYQANELCHTARQELLRTAINGSTQ